MRRWLLLPVVALSGLALPACGGGGYAAPDERPSPVPYADTLPIEEPRERSSRELAELLKESMKEEVGRTLSPDRWISGIPEALNVTALDGVVPSAWFEPRITAGGMSPDRLAAGPPAPGPDTTDVLTVVAAKGAGVSPGFTVRDRKGDVYLVKFDPPGFPGLASGADVVSSRIFWAAGYHVPRDQVFTLNPGLLELAEEATVETSRGERPMRPEDVIEVLRPVDPLADGRYRALASKLVEGEPKGPFRFEGRREDDPNDYYPHEDRRELRGLWVLASWVDHVDLRFANTLDVWIDPPGYLRHYLIDFGATLGSRSIRAANPREGREYAFDLWPTLARLATAGFYRVGWEEIDAEPIRPALGWIARETFEPGAWKPFWPNEAYRRMTDRDGYWGAKLVAAFREDHLRGLVREARYPDPSAGDSLVAALQYRRRKILRHWYARVAPLEEAAVAPVPAGSGRLRLEFDDLGLAEGLWATGETRYRWRVAPRSGEGGASGTAPAGPGSRQGIEVPLPAPHGSGRVTVRIAVLRPGASEREARVGVRRAEDGSWRVVSVLH